MEQPLDEDARLLAVELYAWVGEDELGSGKIGLKQCLLRSELVPLVAVERGKVDRAYLIDGLAQQNARYGKRIYLVRFTACEIVKVIDEPTK